MRLLAIIALGLALPAAAQDQTEAPPAVPPAVEALDAGVEPVPAAKAGPKVEERVEAPQEEPKKEEPKEEVKPEPKPEPKAEVKPEPKPKAKKDEGRSGVGQADTIESEWRFLKETLDDADPDVRKAALSDLRAFTVRRADAPVAPEALALCAQAQAREKDDAGAIVTWLRLFHEFPQAKASSSRAGFSELADRRFGRKLKAAMPELLKVSTAESAAERLGGLVWALSASAADTLYAPAVELSEQVQARFPAFAGADRLQWSVAELHSKNEQSAKALLAYRKLLAVHETSSFRPQAQFAVAKIYAEQLKDYRRAVRAYVEVADRYPEDGLVPVALERAAELYSDRLKQYDAAVQIHERIIKAFPKTEGARKAYEAQAKLQRDRMELPDEAVKTYKRLAAEFGGQAAVAALKSAATVARKDLKNYSLEADLRRSIADDFATAPEAPEELYNVAEILESDLKDLDKAIETYKDVASRFGSHKLAKKAGDRVAKLEKKKQE